MMTCGYADNAINKKGFIEGHNANSARDKLTAINNIYDIATFYRNPTGSWNF